MEAERWVSAISTRPSPVPSRRFPIASTVEVETGADQMLKLLNYRLVVRSSNLGSSALDHP